MRSGENPCRLATLGLPKKAGESEHFAALPYGEVPAFIKKLRESSAGEMTKLAFQFLILNASQSGEVRFALKAGAAAALLISTRRFGPFRLRA